ncbi:MAG: hypothetical protein KDK01_03245 [Rhodobacteraceae bacterium]|jgi:hypothetical protein|nr:hypothetical protein [Paracoccaceae bacterium]
MFESDPTDFAIQGERGIDLFLRLDAPGHKRARFRCIATLLDGGDAAAGHRDAPSALLIDHDPQAKRPAAALLARVAALRDDPLLAQDFTLGDTRGWPRAARVGNPLTLFLYHEFFRAWQVADMTGHRFEAALRRDPDGLPRDGAQLAASIVPVFDFNHLSRGIALARMIEPGLKARIAAPGFADDRAGSTGYALRMLGDLCLRAEVPDLALACFETAIAAGDNPFRRRKAIEAALRLSDPERLAAHLAAYRARWPLPKDLAHLTEGAPS